MSTLYLFVVVVGVVVVIIYNFTKGHNIRQSLPRCASLLLSIILFSVINRSVINAKWRKIKYKYKYIGVHSHT